jgi:putative hydrolase of the HAD superfamily
MDKLQVTSEDCIFVGDGGSDELYGAKKAGMKTIFTEYIERKSEDKIEQIRKYTDYHINSFDELLKYVD